VRSLRLQIAGQYSRAAERTRDRYASRSPARVRPSPTGRWWPLVRCLHRLLQRNVGARTLHRQGRAPEFAL